MHTGESYRRRHTARTMTEKTPSTIAPSTTQAAIIPTPRASANNSASKNRPIATER